MDRIIEIAQDGRNLAVKHGFMLVAEKSEELGRIPLDSIGAVIANAHGITYSNNFLAALAKLGIPLVICGSNHSPLGFLWPIDGNCYQAGRMDAQLKAPKPLAKQLWKKIIQCKINQQAALLDILGLSNARLRFLAVKVTSGDKTNAEATAARFYWKQIFGKDFKRDRNAAGINAMLNYGYTILRSAAARAIIAAGLHPTLGIHHKNSNNPMRLADDLMEPFRPIVDYNVTQLLSSDIVEVTSEAKHKLVEALSINLPTKQGLSTVNICLQNLAASLGQVYQGLSAELNLPIGGIANGES